MNESSQNTPVSVNADEREIDLAELLGMLLAAKYRIAACVLLGLLASLIYVYFATPIYRSDMLVQVETKSSSLDDISALFGAEAASETEIEILRSRFVVGAVVEQLNLDEVIAPNYFPVIGKTFARRFQPTVDDQLAAPLFGLQRYAWGGEQISTSNFEVSEAYLGRALTLRVEPEQRFSIFADNVLLGAGKVNQTFLVGAVAGREPAIRLMVTRIAARPGSTFTLIKQRMTTVINDLQETLAVAEKGKKTGVIKVSLEGENSERIKAILNTLGAVYVDKNIARLAEQAAKSLQALEKRLPTLRREMELADSSLKNYLAANQAVDLTLETQGLLGQLVDVEQKLSSLEIKRAELSQNFADQHPAIIALNEQKRQLEKSYERLQEQAATLPDTQQEVLRLSRDVEVNNAMYTFLLNKSQELRVVEEGTVGNVRVLDFAYQPYLPIKPKKSLIVLMAVFLGIVVGVAWAFLQNLLQRGVVDPRELENTLGLPVYAVVPHSEAQSQAIKSAKKSKSATFPVLLKDNPRDLAIESLRSLRSSLYFGLMEAQNNRIVITGPSPGIGKSFVSVNLAHLLADSGKKVILVDADMRKGHLNKYFSRQREDGLSDVLVGEKTLDDALYHTDFKGLDFLSMGKLPPNPSELLLTEAFQTLLAELDQRYDIVVIDTPPVMAVADALVITPHVGAVFMVVRAGVNTLGEVEEAAKRIKQNNSKVTGMVLNDLTKNMSGRSYGSYGYYYHYTY